MQKPIQITIAIADVLRFEADVLALKYAQKLYGVDELVWKTLNDVGCEVVLPSPGKIVFANGRSAIAAVKVLFVGVVPFSELGYREIRAFSRSVLSAIASAADVQHLALTLHGPGYGLDEIEAFEAEIAGLIDGVNVGDGPPSLTRITIVERNERRASRLRTSLDSLLPGGVIGRDGVGSAGTFETQERLRAAGYASDAKPHVFVAMPFKDEMADAYDYGIQSAAHAAGFLCERADLSAFTGDVLEWIRSRVRSAALVVADLTDANPNVYLEVGYAWGCGIRTVLLIRDGQELKFDVRTQRCLVYKRIKDLEEALAKELKALRETGAV